MHEQTGVETYRNFPMGPRLRTYLGITPDAYGGERAPEVLDDSAKAGFIAHLIATAKAEPPASEDELIDLLDELVAMDLPTAALRLVETCAALWTGKDFRGLLALGVAAMLVGDFDAAEARLVAAQAAIPAEPAPYVNLAQIFMAQERFDDAMSWVLAGLDADRDNLRLWDILAMALEESRGSAAMSELLAEAERRASWAGHCLAAEMSAGGDPHHKLAQLLPLYHRGERAPNFLVELTAAMGVAGEYARIPALVWEAERVAAEKLPWQVHAHCAQALLALGKHGEALARIAKAKRDPTLDDHALAALDELAETAVSGESPEQAPVLH